jgi:HD-GYP domain-containing protein (c-di-GMP phosphodiesterase class II)
MNSIQESLKNTSTYEIMKCLVATLEAKDVYTSGHANRVAYMAVDLCKLLKLSEVETVKIYMASELHDIGKIGVPDEILNKKGPLTNEEWKRIKAHSEIGYSILNKSQKLADISDLILYHHERWDGRGYPHNLKGENIPLGARIIAICDAIDAMKSDRCYRKGLSFKESYNEIISNKGTQFDPFIVNRITNDIWIKWENYLNKFK